MLRRTARDSDLVRRAQQGDRAAFDALVQRHRDLVWAVALRSTGDPTDAEDALQEAFLRAWRALGSFDGRARFSTWLYRIALNCARDAVARRRSTVSLDAEGAPEPEAGGDPFLRDAQARALAAALAGLPDEFREAVVLCDVAGLGAAEAAAVLEVPAGTVKSRCFRGRAMLAEALREPGARDEV